MRNLTNLINFIHGHIKFNINNEMIAYSMHKVHLSTSLLNNYSLLFIFREDELSFLPLQAEESFRKIKEVLEHDVYIVVQNSMRNKNVSYYAY